jgi:hypothetical protein
MLKDYACDKQRGNIFIAWALIKPMMQDHTSFLIGIGILVTRT